MRSIFISELGELPQSLCYNDVTIDVLIWLVLVPDYVTCVSLMVHLSNILIFSECWWLCHKSCSQYTQLCYNYSMSGLWTLIHCDICVWNWQKSASNVCRWYKLGNLLCNCSLLQYRQNPALRRELFATSKTVLVEASKDDCRWGIGSTKDDPQSWRRQTWRGSNWLGNILTDTRDTLMEEEVCNCSASLVNKLCIGE